ncbi:N-acetylneuraminate synthase [Candidatus Synechococcus calcipolaris G9]|uniref:N-acetylneuraminate synthase n=1 Tax=Candidatus Synechococcus calcipolaris G9 TaxID=1497997 RepID=A0ABT6F3I0_9SYNE|nr:N-acetylneuraminate synthase [Candidatus Synechococcus calcipolaris]MDG2992389.1 N-acetylneuraminate synthase [Candidatus Synechococcus calcipolaris G9]
MKFGTHSTFIIAEAGVNHNGDRQLAKELIDIAADAGADAVKFQTFQAEQLVSRYAPKADYQIQTTDRQESQLEMIRQLELSIGDHQDLIDHAQMRGIQFLSTPFDGPSLHLLTQTFGLKTVKIASGEITNAPFLLEIARAAETIILSTGMSTLAEVEAALGVLAFGFIAEKTQLPRRGDFDQAFASDVGQTALGDRVTLLHCTTEYPAPFAEVNLCAMDTLASAFRLPVGYSDHTQGIHIALAAIARGAKIIEKHFTSDRRLPGPDHQASLEPDELKQMVQQIRDIEQCLGDGVKSPQPSEWKNRDIARKSIVASQSIQKGGDFTPENLTCKRPGHGRSPFLYWQTVGKIAPEDFEIDQVLDG